MLTKDKRDELKAKIAALPAGTKEREAYPRCCASPPVELDLYRAVWPLMQQPGFDDVLRQAAALAPLGLSADEAYQRVYPDYVTRHEFRDVWMATHDERRRFEQRQGELDALLEAGTITRELYTAEVARLKGEPAVPENPPRALAEKLPDAVEKPPKAKGS